MSEVKQVKVDNWGIYFLQRLKHFFNRTDYCDLTLQFQDNAQLKVHRLVLSACTEYFELLERTCEMYADCLVMPDDLQADVVVPIVNFMYTGQLEFRLDLLENLYQTAQIMNMPVLTKLLEAHRYQPPVLNYNSAKRSYSKSAEIRSPTTPVASSSSSNKRSYGKAFSTTPATPSKDKRHVQSVQTMLSRKKEATPDPLGTSHFSTSLTSSTPSAPKKPAFGEPRPTRYDLPEEFDTDNIFDNSFTNISYGSQPLMVHPETTKRYPSKRMNIFSGASGSIKGDTSTVDIVECKKITRKDNIFEDYVHDNIMEDAVMFPSSRINVKQELPKVSNQLFDQILDEDVISSSGPKVTIETKDNQQVSNVDHAKIISEVLKKYPHLVKSNKNIKLKILNTLNPNVSKPKARKAQASPPEVIKPEPDYTYETDVLDSKEAARLIALGAENIKGPWICLICGTPGRALHFVSYFKFRRHLVDVHNEKPVSKICEYCGLKSLKRNYLLHHLYTKHGVEPPASYHFPKCNQCNYVALTEGFLIKHKASHSENRNFRCNVCASSFNTSNQLLAHIQSTGHKYSAERKTSFQCIYCLKLFSLESNLYAHLKTNHSEAAKSDGVIDESDEERETPRNTIAQKADVQSALIKYEPPNYDYEDINIKDQYQIQQRPDGNIQLISTKSPAKQKILNTGLITPAVKHLPKPKPVEKIISNNYEYLQDISISPNKKHQEEIVVIDNDEYIMRDNQLIPRKKMTTENEYIISELTLSDADHNLSSTTMEFSNIPEDRMPQQKMIIKKSTNLNQPIQIVVSNEAEYKALMNSNHSIIFDDGDANKTLTVLSTPHNTTLNATTIDLENNQPRDVMILPDMDTMTASEAMPTDNSNIVVVYSHPVHDQNKQFQIISSQDIGTQFVQSSAVITQNYGTITSSTPVMNAHVMNAQITESWQNNIQEDIQEQQAEMTASEGLQEMAVIQQNEMTGTANEEEEEISELPEVTLTTEILPETAIHAKEVEENLIQDNSITNEIENENDQNNVEILQPESSETTEDTNVVADETAHDDGNDHGKQLTLTDDSSSSANVNMPVVIDDQQISAECTIIDQGVEVEEHEEGDENEINEVIVNDTQNLEERINEVHESEDTAAENNETVATSLPPTSDQIQTLTSEWSEEEDETGVQDTNDPEEPPVDDYSADNPTTDTSIEVESVENVHQEIENGSTDIIQEDSVNASDQAQTHAQADGNQEKISSLLNDWEDNESQEDCPANGNEENISTATETTENNKEIELKEQEEPKNDKIKNLVSDWDDDDEENKN